MTRDQLDATPQQTAQQVLVSVPGGPGYDARVLVAVEQAMNLEWWRGYYTAVDLSRALNEAVAERAVPECDRT